VPCLIRGPGIPAGTICNELMGTIDVLPTIAAITGKPLPKKNKIDGMDMLPLWTGKAEESPREEFVYYTSRGQVEGIRQGDWKVLVKKRRGQTTEPQIFLFNLNKDVGEETNRAGEHPEIVNRLRSRMEELDAEITANARAPWLKK